MQSVSAGFKFYVYLREWERRRRPAPQLISVINAANSLLVCWDHFEISQGKVPKCNSHFCELWPTLKYFGFACSTTDPKYIFFGNYEIAWVCSTTDPKNNFFGNFEIVLVCSTTGPPLTVNYSLQIPIRQSHQSECDTTIIHWCYSTLLPLYLFTFLNFYFKKENPQKGLGAVSTASLLFLFKIAKDSTIRSWSVRKVSADSFFLLLLILNNEILNPVSGTSLLPAVNHAFYSLEGNAKALTLGGKANFFPRALTFTSPSLGKGDFCFRNLTKIFRNTIISLRHT